MTAPVDSYKFLSYGTRKLVQAWIRREPRREIPWTPLPGPLSRCRLALVSTAGLAMATDRPFDQEGEVRNPWWGDPTFRVIPRDACPRDVRIYHLHMENRYAEEDLDCVLPLRRLGELAMAGEVGEPARSHFSFMGYILDPTVLLRDTVPEMIRILRREEVDAALLIPF